MKIPYLGILLSLVPIVMLAYVIPPHADSYLFVTMSSFIKERLLGEIGPISSVYPFTSMVINNYVSLVTPILSVYFLMLVVKRSSIPASVPLCKIAKYKFFISYFGMVAITAIIFIQNYASNSKPIESRYFYWIDGNVIFFVIYAMAAMMSIFAVIFLNFILFYLVPRLYIKNRNK